MDLKSKKIFWNILGGSFAKGMNILIALILTPPLLNYLGNTQFGIFSTIYSFYIINNILDLGLGMYLQNKIPELSHSSDKTLLHRAISTVFFALLGIALLSLILFLSLENHINWAFIFKTNSDAFTASKSIKIFVYCWALYLPFSMVQKIRIGYQNAYKSDLWVSIGNVLGMIFCFVFIHEERSLPYFILAIFGSSTFVNFIHFFSFFHQNSNLIPNSKLLDNQLFKHFFKESFIYFTLQTSALILISSDSILIAHYMGVSHVTTYTLLYRIFGLCILPVSLIVSPIFYSLNEAFAQNDMAWVRKNSRKTLFFLIPVSLIIYLLLILTSDSVVSFWLKKEIHFPLEMLLSFGWLVVVFNLNMFVANVSNTTSYFKKSFKIYPLACLITLIAKIIMVQIWGISGVVLAYGVFIPLFYFIPFFRIFIRDNIL